MKPGTKVPGHPKGGMARVKIIYLDTWAWIRLEQALTNQDNNLQKILQHLQKRVKGGFICLPLSLTHCLEMIKRCNVDDRRRLWSFATRLSGCFGMLNKESLLPMLINKAVAKVFNVNVVSESVEVFTNSGLFGIESGGQCLLTDHYLTTENGWISFWMDMPSDVCDSFLDPIEKSEKEFVKRRNELKELWRKEQQDNRKKAYIARLFYDLQTYYHSAMMSLGKNQEDIEHIDMEDRLRLVTEVPPLDVEVSLAVQHQQQWDKEERDNDARDIGHLCMAIPYCDVVITERYWIDKIKKEKIDVKYGTQVSSDIGSLLNL